MSDEDGLSRAEYINKIANKNKPLFVKFKASWCGPCKSVKTTIDKFLKSENATKIEYLEIDIDNSIDAYAFLKSKKMIYGVPSLLFYDMSDKSFVPTMCLTTGNIEDVNDFLSSMIAKL